MWRRRAPSPCQLRLAWLTELVRAIHADSRGTYGWRRINAELVYGHGVIVNHKTVRKIMRAQGLHGLPGARKSFRRKANMATTADLVERRFARPDPDQLWVTDITEHPTREGKVYCCVVLDVFSRRSVSRLSAPIPHAASRRSMGPCSAASLSSTDVVPGEAASGFVMWCGWHGMQEVGVDPVWWTPKMRALPSRWESDATTTPVLPAGVQG
jgi:hypothetical protein